MMKAMPSLFDLNGIDTGMVVQEILALFVPQGERTWSGRVSPIAMSVARYLWTKYAQLYLSSLKIAKNSS